MASSTPRLALKVDCDTYQGSKAGIPNLLKLFDEFRIRATFFFTLGPDTSGRAITRIFTRKGFLKKMLRSNAAALYGPKTMLYGTLLPAPRIGELLKDVIRSVDTAGQDTGVHAWDHIRWHDRLDRLSEEEIERDYGRAHAAFADIFGRPARASAAPGWHATSRSLAVQSRHNLLYTSDTRQGSPFFPEAEGRVFGTLEIPSTFPTWDEMLGDPQYPNEAAFIDAYAASVQGTEVHSIHTEVEGTARLDLFRRQLDRWRADGVKFVTLEELALEALAHPQNVPIRRLERTSIPNRAGLVTTGV